MPLWISAVVAVVGSFSATLVFGFRTAIGWRPEWTLFPLGTLFVIVLWVGKPEARINAVDDGKMTRYRDTSLLYVACITLWLVWGHFASSFVADSVKNGLVPYVYCTTGWLIYTGFRDFFREQRQDVKLRSELAANPVSKNALMMFALGVSWIGAAYPSYLSVDNDKLMLGVHYSMYTLIFFGHVWFTVHYRIEDLPLAHLFCATYWLLFVPQNFWQLYVFTGLYLIWVMYRLEQRRRKEQQLLGHDASAQAQAQPTRTVMQPGDGIASMTIPTSAPVPMPPPASVGHASTATTRHSYPTMPTAPTPLAAPWSSTPTMPPPMPSSGSWSAPMSMPTSSWASPPVAPPPMSTIASQLPGSMPPPPKTAAAGATSFAALRG